MAQRSVASGTISFGLVAIPVKLYVLASSENISFNQIGPNGRRVRQFVREEDGAEITDKSTIRKGYEHSKGQYVIFTDEEIAKLEDGEKGTMAIDEFVSADSIDYDHVEKSYHVGPNKGGERAFNLLSLALFTEKKVAVAQWTNRGRQHLVVIANKGSGLVLHQMFYADEIREFAHGTEGLTPKPQELDMACRLIASMDTGKYDSSKYKDSFRHKLLAAVEAKKNGEEIPNQAPANDVNVGDLFAALIASLAKK